MLERHGVRDWTKSNPSQLRDLGKAEGKMRYDGAAERKIVPDSVCSNQLLATHTYIVRGFTYQLLLYLGKRFCASLRQKNSSILPEKFVRLSVPGYRATKLDICNFFRDILERKVDVNDSIRIESSYSLSQLEKRYHGARSRERDGTKNKKNHAMEEIKIKAEEETRETR